METSSVQVPIANIRKKVLNYSISVILTIAITTTGILIYDKVLEQELSTRESQRSGGQFHAPLSSNGSVTIGTQTTELAIPSTLPGLNATSAKTLTSTSVEQETTETETMSSRVTVLLTTGVTFSKSVQTSKEHTTFEDTSTCQPNLSNIAVTSDHPTDCSGFDIAVGQNEIHTIYPDGSPNKTARVNCVSSCDGRWTVIQQRFDGSVDFYRNWADYKEGFGDASGEYWLGNDAIYQLTSRYSYKLKVVLKNWDNVTAHATYDIYQVSDESDGYRLSIGSYHGDAGDSLKLHNGEMFSTLDRDNDSHSVFFCAVRYTGAWWYHHCCHSNLNGRYFNATVEGRIIWGTFSSESLKETTMMIQQI